MFASHKVATAVGGLGTVAILGHVVLGPSVVPVPAAILGLILLVAAGLAVAIPRHRSNRHDRQAAVPRQPK